MAIPWRKQSLHDLVEGFATASIGQDEAIIAGSVRDSIKYGKATVRFLNQLLKHGDTGRDALKLLLSHPHPSARVKAAACLLRYDTRSAMGVLEEAAQFDGLVGFSAREAIARWQEGDWSLDPG